MTIELGMGRAFCGYCRFWKKADVVSNNPYRGYCVRYAPRPEANPEERQTEWPLVWDSDWCGEWEKHPLVRDEV